jgi:hypothetical protein
MQKVKEASKKAKTFMEAQEKNLAISEASEVIILKELFS